MRFVLLIASFAILSCNQAQKGNTRVINENTNRDEALDQIERLSIAIHSDSSNATLYNDRAVYFMAIQKYELAERDLIKSIDIDPNDAAIWDNYGSLKGKQGDYEAAYTAYSKAIRLSPSEPQFISNVGWSLLNMGQFEKSIKYFDEAIVLDNTLNVAYTNKGLALIGLEQKEEGCKLLQLSLGRGVKEVQSYIDQYCR